MTSVAIFIDRAMLPGAHVVLLTAALHHGPELLDFHVFETGLKAGDGTELRRTLEKTGHPFRLSFHPFDPSGRFQRFNRLHGSLMTYGRLLLPELLPGHRRVLYLDSDLLVRTDLLRVFTTDLGGCALGAVATETFDRSLDGPLAVSKRIPGDTPHFNAGVLLFDLDQWRSQELTRECLAFIADHSIVARSHDQTALNFVLRRRFKLLPDSLNVCVEPWTRQPLPAAEILHFIGSPKPFDPVGRWLHGGRREYWEWQRQTTILETAPRLCGWSESARRLWHTRRSIAHCLLNRLKPGAEPETAAALAATSLRLRR